MNGHSLVFFLGFLLLTVHADSNEAMNNIKQLRKISNNIAKATVLYSKTQNSTDKNESQNETNEVQDQSFWGSFVASLSMICLAEFGDRVCHILL